MRKCEIAATVIAILAAAGCAEPPYAPVAPTRSITANSTARFALVPGQDVPEMPTVRVVDAGNMIPVSGVAVTFKMTTPSPQPANYSILGVTTHYSTLTDGSGNARLNAWALGRTPGQYIVTATADGTDGTAEFRAFVRGDIVARYYNDPIVGIEPSLVFYDDGSYYSGPDLTGYPTGKYKWDDPVTLELFIDPLDRVALLNSARFGYLYKEGVLNGNRLTISSVDGDKLVYFKR